MSYSGIQGANGLGALRGGAASQPGSLLNVERGVNGTTPALHQRGAVVVLLIAAPCVGDCNRSGDVTVNELVTMVNVALGNTGRAECLAGDANNDSTITVNEIITAVNNALNGCG